jgi:hypothetical protein
MGSAKGPTTKNGIYAQKSMAQKKRPLSQLGAKEKPKHILITAVQAFAKAISLQQMDHTRIEEHRESGQ